MFEFIMQTATTTPSAIDNIVAIILALGAISAFIGHLLTTNTKFKKLGVYMTTFGQKTVEQENNIATLGEVVTTVSPEAAAQLQKLQASTAEFRRRAEIAEAQLAKLQPTIPEKMQADNKDDLPR